MCLGHMNQMRGKVGQTPLLSLPPAHGTIPPANAYALRCGKGVEEHIHTLPLILHGSRLCTRPLGASHLTGGGWLPPLCVGLTPPTSAHKQGKQSDV